MATHVGVQHRVHRKIDGSDNAGRDLGRVGRPLLRLGLPVRDFDPQAEPNPRQVSNLASRQRGERADPYDRSEFVWAWGQFLDHELDLIRDREKDENGRHREGDTAPIRVPDDDHRLEFRGTDIPFVRSVRAGDELPNSHTAYIDASNVYGTCDERLTLLRTYEGGKLKEGAGRLLPPQEPGMHDCRTHETEGAGLDSESEAAAKVVGSMIRDDAEMADMEEDLRPFMAGDVRANEHCVLLALHTVFVREHNRLCDELADRDASWDDEELFQRARKIVGAEMQAITYNEFLPALLGGRAIPAYGGFNHRVDPGISVLFATVGFRLGHSMVRDDVVLTPDGYRLPLAHLFFAHEFVYRLGVEPWLSRLAYRPMLEIDPSIVDGLRDFLFRNREGNGSQQMLDLAALNIQRGRDHGLPDFNACRRTEEFELPHVSSFDALTGDSRLARQLERAYGTIDRLDPWVGALAEQPSEGRRVGDLLHAVLVDQFTRLRDGDFYWYENDPYLDDEDRARVQQTTLGDIIERNTEPLDVGAVVAPRHVFIAP